jgi:L-ascorbate metabolism protein UlaG (beta-lactamase superfamily)
VTSGTASPESPSAASFRLLGHGTVLLPGPPRVVVDPWRTSLRDEPPADVVLVTDGRPDHACEEDVAAVSAPGTTVLAPRGLAPRCSGLGPGVAVVPLDAGASWEGPGLRVLALPARGPSRASGFLPPGAGLAYLVETGGTTHLFLGASDALPEHEGLAPDVAFFAVGDFTVPSPEEAAAAAARVRPRLAVATHWGDLSGRHASALRFADLCRAAGTSVHAPA